MLSYNRALLATLCVHERLYFTFMVTGQFVFILHIIFMFHEHSYAFCISNIFLISCLFHMEFQILVLYDAYPHIIHVFLSLDASTLLRNWNHSNQIIQTQVMAFSCPLVGLPIFPEGQFEIFIFQCLVSVFDTVSLYSFKVKVLRFYSNWNHPIRSTGTQDTSETTRTTL